MKELRIIGYVTEAAVAEHERVMIQVDGCGMYAVELSLEGEVWSTHVTLRADGSQVTTIGVCPNTQYRVRVIKGHMESVKAIEADIYAGEGGGGAESPDYDFGDAGNYDPATDVEDFGGADIN